MVDGKKISVKLLNEITLTPLNLTQKEQIQYYRLRRKVHKVYPYAQKAKLQLLEIDEDLKYVNSKRKKKQLARLHDKWLQDNFTDDLKKLTRSEGRILIKLIHYETGITAYAIIKKYRSGLKALFWQQLAKHFDGDLKTEFNPEASKEDIWIEYILWRMKKENEVLLK
jgi:hypothetical protein